MNDVRARVDARLVAFFATKEEETRRLSPESSVLVSAVRDLTMRGGKRLRAAVLTAGFRAVAPDRDVAATTDACASLELLQTYLLVHDDWMDGDEERRGGPSVHVALSRIYGDPHLGASMAILAGDLASAYSWELLLSSPFPEGRAIEGLRAFERLQEEVFFGQHLDLARSADVARMHQLKTGSYTVRGPIALGAILASASPAQLDALDRYARPLGLAFQLRDDLLGTFGDPRATGKPVGGDLREGKNTSVLAWAREHLGAKERAELDRVLGSRDASDADVAAVTATLERAGARDAIERELGRLLAESEAALSDAPLAPEGVDLLRDVAHLLAMRDR